VSPLLAAAVNVACAFECVDDLGRGGLEIAEVSSRESLSQTMLMEPSTRAPSRKGIQDPLPLFLPNCARHFLFQGDLWPRRNVQLCRDPKVMLEE
jgi:hypothetical protein